jgi:hypothetical protein
MCGLLKLPIFVLVLAGLASCGYSFHRSEASLGGPKGEAGVPQTLFIPVTDNLATKTGVEGLLTSALRETLASIEGLTLVNRAEDARFVMLTSITKYQRRSKYDTNTGTAETQARGGLIKGISTASDIEVLLAIDVRLVENVDPRGQLRRAVWKKNFSRNRTFEAFNRFEEAEGAASAVQINESRELLQVQKISVDLAQKVKDQLEQDF